MQIKDKSTDLIVDTHYYKWLQSNNVSNVHYIDTKIEYLVSQGFVLKQDKLSPEDLNILKAIEQVYAYSVLIPKN